MKKIVFILFMSALSAFAQKGDLRQGILQKLREGNCEGAQKIYNVYKAEGKRDRDIEARIAQCQKSKGSKKADQKPQQTKKTQTSSQKQKPPRQRKVLVSTETTEKPDSDCQKGDSIPILENSKQVFDVVAGFFTSKEEANMKAKQLRALGCDPYIISRDGGYYVSMGSAPTRNSAQAMMEHIQTWYKSDVKIYEFNKREIQVKCEFKGYKYYN